MRGSLAHLALLAVVALAAVLPAGRAAAQAQVSAADQRCLGCHARRGLFKQLDNGDHMTMVVAADLFAKSAHAANACTDCHTDVKLSKHPKARKTIDNARAYAIAQVQVCQTCHDKEAGAWGNSIHATLVFAGNAGAPVCTGCHRPHGEPRGMSDAVENLPCKSCHDTIFAAYAGSVHGMPRSDGNVPAVLCSGCHNAHDVSVASSPAGPKNACLACHEGVLQKHEAWLPNAALHFDAVSCPVCHAPTALRRVDLQLIAGGGQTRLTEKAGVPTFQTLGNGVDAIALYNLLQTLGQQSTTGRVGLRGRLEVAAGEPIHRLAPKSAALRRCAACHSAGSDAFQSVSISVAGPDGLPIRYVADRKVLSSAMSIGSIGGFYAIGGTRIELLDSLVLLAVLAGIGVPAAHLLLGVIVRRRRKARDGASARGRPD